MLLVPHIVLFFTLQDRLCQIHHKSNTLNNSLTGIKDQNFWQRIPLKLHYKIQDSHTYEDITFEERIKNAKNREVKNHTYKGKNRILRNKKAIKIE